MIPRRILGANVIFGPPEGMTKEECSQLAARVVDGVCQSAWEPTPAELAALNAGGSVVLSVWGRQPPVALTVEPATAEAEGP